MGMVVVAGSFCPPAPGGSDRPTEPEENENQGYRYPQIYPGHVA